MAKAAISRLRTLRLAAGLSVRQFAREIGEHHTNVSFWERTGNLPRSNVLLPMAKVLGVTVEDLLGESERKRTRPAAGGKLGQVFERVSKLPRRQQQKVIEMAEGFLSLHEDGKSKANGS